MIESPLAGKAVAITGAGGSIGSELCRAAIAGGARRLVLVSLTESGLYNIVRKLNPIRGACELHPTLGSVTDARLMHQALANTEIVIHAAAHKHVPICENNPVIAVENNAIGTYVLSTAAQAAHVEQFVLVSTDKAVNPASVMGASKRLAELVVTGKMLQASPTKFLIVRFGNVMDSAGSVMPLWREQIAAGGPLTITDPACTRFFMSIPDAVELILGTLRKDICAGTYIFDMGEPVRLVDIAARMIAESGKRIPIEYIGLRPGEKLTEELHHGGELVPTWHPKVFRVLETGAAMVSQRDRSNLWESVRVRDGQATRDILMRIVA